MASRVDQERVRALIKKIGSADHKLGKALGLNQSTIWRLRHGKISKVHKYIDLLNDLLPLSDRDQGAFDPELLIALAQQSPALRNLLSSLSDFMQENATKLAGES